MGAYTKLATAIAVAALIPVASAAANPGRSGAEKIRQLDIMLMVTGLRCRTGVDNFQADYARFSAMHLAELNAAAAVMRADYARRYGSAGSQRVMDRISTSMANTYGQGHPWLSCAELRTVTRGLAAMRGTAPLEEAADQLLSPHGTPASLARLTR